ncbi:MAG TPA: signal peptidase II [Candidatus Baltobacteraceae bacterium]|nr:signal peptidase II [Candidatus Baltobacteraceae bacterium]
MSRHRKFNSPGIILIVAAIVLLLDQWSKRLVISSFMPGESRLVVVRLLRWTYERNFHGAFGLFGSNGALLVALAIVVLVIFWLSFRDAAAQSRLVCVAFGMIVGGAIGNIIDRVHFGFVVDFIDFYKVWPNIFNVADSCITIGVVLLLLSSLGTSRRRA